MVINREHLNGRESCTGYCWHLPGIFCLQFDFVGFFGWEENDVKRALDFTD